MIGRTNVGGNVPASLWYAYIQVSTDANAVITAVNPAGNSYTKTADENGSAIFVVGYPGTYTISETGATSQTVVVADYGVAYLVTIHATPSFDGRLITNGATNVSFVAQGTLGRTIQSKAPTANTIDISVGAETYWTKFVYVTNGSGMYVTENTYDLTQFSKLVINKQRYNTRASVCFVDDTNSPTVKPIDHQDIEGSSYGQQTFYLNTFDLVTMYVRIGVMVESTGTAGVYIKDLWLE